MEEGKFMGMSHFSTPDIIVNLNVGGQKFSTSRHTLTWIPDSFFTSLLSGRISTVKDESGAIFIDRDPKLFSVVLNYLRTRQVDLSGVNLTSLKHEAQYYGLAPLIKRLTLCDELERSTCGDVLFHGYLPPPTLPLPEATASLSNTLNRQAAGSDRQLGHSRNISEPPVLPSRQNCGHQAHNLPPRPLPSMEAKFQVPSLLESPVNSGQNGQPGSKGPPGLPKPTPNTPATQGGGQSGHSRTSSAEYFKIGQGRQQGYAGSGCHSKRSSGDLTKQIRADLCQILKQHHQKSEHAFDPYRVRLIRGHHNWIAVAYAYSVCCFRMKDSQGWQEAYCTPRMEALISRITLNAKFGNQSSEKMLAAALTNHTIHLWGLGEDGANQTKIGVFSLNVPVDTLFFIGNQLVGLSKTGKVGIWHSMTQNWQVQDVCPISSYDTAGSFLLLGCSNGSIYYIDMQKFPLRMKDNDLLVTELYKDPSADVITAISVYLTPKTNLCGNWIEIAYGTSGGLVRVIVQHPETVGHGPQLFQTFTVHQAPITRVALTTNHLISVCSEYNHVRSWSVTRFRGMISTQPGSTPIASFKVLTLESVDGNLDPDSSDSGPFGDQDGEQLFIQKIVPETNQVFVRLASNGERVCVIRSVDDSSVTGYLVHECEGSSRMGSRSRRYLFTGHSNGSIQMWDLSTALDIYQNKKEKGGQGLQLQGPTSEELLHLIDECEITCNSLSTTPSTTPYTSITHLPGLIQGHVNLHS